MAVKCGQYLRLLYLFRGFQYGRLENLSYHLITGSIFSGSQLFCFGLFSSNRIAGI